MAWLMQDVRPGDEPLLSVSPTDLRNSGIVVDRRLHHYAQIASYNWIEKFAPTILIPGQPAKFINWTGGQLQADSDYLFVPLPRRPCAKFCGIWY